MSTNFVSSQLIKNIQKTGRSIAVEYVEKTTTWTRPTGFPSPSIKSEFTKVVEENLDTLTSETARVAMKESEHQSDADKRTHYTVYELDKDGKVIVVQHLVRKK